MKNLSLFSSTTRMLALNILTLSTPVTAYLTPLEYKTVDTNSKKTKTLKDLCSHSVKDSVEDSVENESSLIRNSQDEAIRAAAAATLNNIQGQFPHSQISRCVILLPDGKPVDEAIEHFNRNRAPEDKVNTAFLVIGSGIKTVLKNPAERGRGLRLVNAEGSRDLLPNHWQGKHKVNKTITLEKGQKLIGVPLTPDLKLAKEFYIGLEPGSETGNSGTFDTSYKKSLIHSGEAGILITGISTAPLFLSNPDGRKATKAPATTFELLKFELNPELYSADSQLEKNIVNIFSNELVQANKQSLSAFADETFLYSGKIEGKTLFNIKDNHFYSYNNQSAPQNPYLLTNNYSFIDFYYSLRNTTFLRLEGNHFFGECKKSLLGDIRDISEKYFIQNNLFNCWVNGDNPSDLKLKNNPIPMNAYGSGESNRVIRYISYQNGNRFKGAFHLPGPDLQADSNQQASAHRRRRFIREAGQGNEKQPETNLNARSPDRDNRTLIYSAIAGVVVIFGFTLIHMALTYLNWVKIRALENKLKPSPAPRDSHTSRIPQFPRDYKYQLVSYHRNYPGKIQTVALPALSAYQPLLPVSGLPPIVEGRAEDTGTVPDKSGKTQEYQKRQRSSSSDDVLLPAKLAKTGHSTFNENSATDTGSDD